MSANRLTMPMIATKRRMRFASSFMGTRLAGEIVAFHPPRPDRRRHAMVVLDEDAATAPSVPGPSLIAHTVRVGPIHERRDVTRAAIRSVIRFAGFAENQRHDFGNRFHARIEAGHGVAQILSVNVR